MQDELIEIAKGLTIDDEIRIYVSGEETTEIGDVEVESFESTVEYTMRKRFDKNKGDDFSGWRKEIFVTGPEGDEVHEEYVLTAEIRLRDERRLSFEARDYFEGSPAGGKYAIHPIGISDIEIIE